MNTLRVAFPFLGLRYLYRRWFANLFSTSNSESNNVKSIDGFGGLNYGVIKIDGEVTMKCESSFLWRQQSKLIAIRCPISRSKSVSWRYLPVVETRQKR